MMMISHNRRPRFSSGFFAVVFVLVVLAFLVGVWRSAVSSLLWRVLSPVMTLRNDIEAGSAAELRTELASTTAALTDRNLLYQENLDLKARLGRNANHTVTLAAVLERPAGTPYDTLTIDAGAQDGIQKGQLVAASGSALIGRIDEVYATTARVVLFSSPGQEYTALINSLTPVSLAGQGGGSLHGEVPAGTAVKVGDPLVIMGIGEGLMGEVSAVAQKEGQSFEDIYAHLPANPQELRFVEVWK